MTLQKKLTGRRYTEKENAWLHKHCTMMIHDYHRAFCAKFGRSDVTPAQLKRKRIYHGWVTGRRGAFAKGHRPPNMFPKGHTPHNLKPEGSEIGYSGKGYRIVTIAHPDQNCRLRKHSSKHRWLWEKENGPIPDGMRLMCKGDIADADPSNWKLVPAGLIARLNRRRFADAPDELKPTIMAVAKLERRVCAAREAK